MIFSNSTSKTGIVEDIDYLVGSDSSSYPIEQKTRNINRKYDEVVSLILSCDGRWQWDDTNNTDLPIATTTLVDSQADYNISGSTFLDVTRVEVKDINGNYQLLKPFDQRDITNQSLTEFQETPGMPLFYDKVGDSIVLYPKPSSSYVTNSEGLKVYFQRNASYFTVSDTTKSPGFAAPFHRLLSFGASLDYAIANTLNSKITILTSLIQKMEQSLIEFYSTKSRDEQVKMRTRKENYGAGTGLGISDKVVY